MKKCILSLGLSLFLLIVLGSIVSASDNANQYIYYAELNHSTGPYVQPQPGDKFSLQFVAFVAEPTSITFTIPVRSSTWVSQTNFIQSENVTGTWELKNNTYVFQGIVNPDQFGAMIGFLTIVVTLDNFGPDNAPEVGATIELSPTDLYEEVSTGVVIIGQASKLFRFSYYEVNQQANIEIVLQALKSGNLTIEGTIQHGILTGTDSNQANNRFSRQINITEGDRTHLPIISR